MKKTRKTLLAICVLAIAAAAVLGLASCDLGLSPVGEAEGGTVINNYNITVKDDNTGLRYAAQEVIDSVVTITAEFKNSWKSATLAGSGTIVTSDGYILTNRHVVSMSGFTLQSIKVVTINAAHEEKSYHAELVPFAGTFDLDVRLIKITDAGNKTFKPVSIAKSSTLQMGDTAFMLGNSASTGFTLSTATVAHPRSTEFKDSGLGFTYIVKLNADVNHGNSGGGLFNLKGDMVGIVTYRKEGSSAAASDMIQGIGYAIRTEDILNIVKAHYGDTIYDKLTLDAYDDIYDTTVKAA